MARRIRSESEVQALLKTAGFERAVERIEPLESGMLNDTFFAFAREPDERVAIRIRVFENQEYGQEFAAERLAYPLLDLQAVDVPALRFFNTLPTFPNPKVAVFEFVDGVRLDHYFANRPTAHESSSVISQLAIGMAAIHSVRGPGYGTLREITHPSSDVSRFLESLFEKEAHRLHALDSFTAERWNQAMPRMLQVMKSLPAEITSPCLVHGDIHWRNLIARRDGGLSFIDWESSRYRLAPYDFAQLTSLHFRPGDESFDELLDKYANYRSPKEIQLVPFRIAVAICQSFWKCRMAMFLLQHPECQDVYFGSPQSLVEELRTELLAFI